MQAVMPDAARVDALIGPPLQRISIVGATGSGKTFLARRLAAKLDLPLHELDEVRRAAVEHGGFGEAVGELAAASEWIIDGHYRDVRAIVWRRADTIVWLNYPASVIAAQLLRRFAAKRGYREVRGAGAAGASWTMRLRRLARTLSERREYGALLRSPEYRGATLIELRSRKAAEEWLECVGQ